MLHDACIEGFCFRHDMPLQGIPDQFLPCVDACFEMHIYLAAVYDPVPGGVPGCLVNMVHVGGAGGTAGEAVDGCVDAGGSRSADKGFREGQDPRQESTLFLIFFCVRVCQVCGFLRQRFIGKGFIRQGIIRKRCSAGCLACIVPAHICCAV